jgi:iron complex outermembrane recepter protein
MPQIKPTPTRCSTAVRAAVLTLAAQALAGVAWAQAPAAPAAPAASASAPAAAQVIEVTGIRASLEKSLATKRAAVALVEAITAEDVGKMPDKNLADSLQRLPTLAVRTDYDEAEKVSMRGTNPDMTLIIFNGHTVSGGDWYIADQQSSSRSTSLSLMPSSVLNQALVYRTSQANIADGGLAGTINVTTRTPLSQRKPFGGVVSLGAVYSTLPAKSAPDLSAVMNWKNDTNDFGILGQVFAEKRYMRRDTLSRNGFNFGWTTIDIAGLSTSASPMRGITDASLAGTGLKAADLNGVRMPSAMGSEFIEGVRDRTGGVLSLQWKPVKGVDLVLTSFRSAMNANNYGRLTGSAMEAMLRGQSFYASAAAPSSATLPNPLVYASIKNPVIATGTTYWGDEIRYLKSADVVFANGTRPALVGLSDHAYRDGASSTSAFTDLNARWDVSDRLVVKALLSTTKGTGETKEDQGIAFYRFGQGVSYTLNGLSTAPNFSFINAGSNAPVLNADGSGYQPYTQRNSRSRTLDTEDATAVNAEYDVGWNGLTTLDVGLRFADHKRNFQRWVYTRKRVAYDPLPTTGLQSYPDNFASGIPGGGFDKTGFYYDQGTLQAWIDNQWRSYGDDWDRLMSSYIDMRERQSAAYVMQNFDEGKFSGNVGVRFVRTEVDSNIVNRLPAGFCVKTEPGKPVTPCARFPGAIIDAADLYNWYDGDVFGKPLGSATFTTQAAYTQPYYLVPTKRVFNNVLPSLNLRYEIQKNMLLRAGASQTIGRQNYNVWAQGVTSPTCNATTGICTVVGPNPDLKPLTADNFDVNWSWYFARNALVTVGYFESKIKGYTKFGGLRQDTFIELLDPVTDTLKNYYVISAGQQKARIKGFDIGYEQPIGKTGFGVTSNVSRAITRVEDGRPMTGASEWSGNLGLYYEDSKLSARVVVNYRGEYVASATAPAPNSNSQANTVIQGVTLPATALTWAAPVTNVAFSASYKFTPAFELHFSATNLTDPVRAQYRYGEYELQKQDVSGRQYYLNAKYKF